MPTPSRSCRIPLPARRARPPRPGERRRRRRHHRPRRRARPQRRRARALHQPDQQEGAEGRAPASPSPATPSILAHLSGAPPAGDDAGLARRCASCRSPSTSRSPTCPRALTPELLEATLRVTQPRAVGPTSASPRRASPSPASTPTPARAAPWAARRSRSSPRSSTASAPRASPLTGPHSADTLFHPAARARYDAAVCMYHDQALIPIKTLDFDGGVNVTLGLDFVRTSPDHGTAYDIAGQGIAEPREPDRRARARPRPWRAAPGATAREPRPTACRRCARSSPRTASRRARRSARTSCST